MQVYILCDILNLEETDELHDGISPGINQVYSSFRSARLARKADLIATLEYSEWESDDFRILMREYIAMNPIVERELR